MGIDNDVFFHYSTLVGTHISEMGVGSSLNFNTKMNGNQKVATNVRLEPVEEVNKNLGHFQMMTANQAIAHQEKPTTGKITEICGHTHGFIDNEVFFHYSSLAGTHISELSVGTSLVFTASVNGTQRVARDVRVATAPEVKINVVPELAAIKNILELEGLRCYDDSVGTSLLMRTKRSRTS